MRGFTLIEVLIVIGIIGLISAFGYAISISGFQRYAFSAERDLVLNLVQKARSQAMNNVLQVPHGIRVESGEYVLFSDDGTPGNDVSFPRDSSVTVAVSGDGEITFAQLSGNADAAETIHLSKGDDAAEIVVEDNGRIDWHYE